MVPMNSCKGSGGLGGRGVLCRSYPGTEVEGGAEGGVVELPSDNNRGRKHSPSFFAKDASTSFLWGGENMESSSSPCVDVSTITLNHHHLRFDYCCSILRAFVVGGPQD